MMFINSDFVISKVNSFFQTKSFSLTDTKIRLIATLILGMAALATAAYWIYRSCSFKSIKETPKITTMTDSIFSKDPLEKQKIQLTKKVVIKEAKKFHLDHNNIFPTLKNNETAIDQVEKNYSEQVIINALQQTQVLVHPSVSTLIDGFLEYKLKFGSNIEKKLYASMTKEKFVERLIAKRPFVFMNSNDYYVLKNGKTGNAAPKSKDSNPQGFEMIGTDNEPTQRDPTLTLENYLSYDEMEIAAMIGVSVPTAFINNGHKGNQGVIDDSNHYEKEGICLGLVGVRLERENYMEFQRVMVTPTQNKKEKGYGELPLPENDNAITAKMRLYAQFYGIDHFPTYEEVKNNSDYVQCGNAFISEKLYKHRMKINIENYLHDANERAKHFGKQAYAQPYGWGLSAWIKHPIQREWFIEAFLEVMQSQFYDHISDVDFSFVMKYLNQSTNLKNFLQDNGKEINCIKLHFPEPKECRELCAKLEGEHEGKLLVNSYGWDGNSYCGNEYWDGMLTASGDPVMMCASPLQVFAQVPEINPYLTENIHFVGQPK